MANSSHVILNKDMDKYKEISDFRRRAFEFISQAIQCEETGKNEKFAQSLYQVRNISRGQFPRFFYFKSQQHCYILVILTFLLSPFRSV